MTIAAIILCPKLLTLGLYQSIYNLTIPLRLKDILAAPSISNKDGGIGLSITWSLISDVIKRIYTAGVTSVFKDSNYYPKMLNMHCLNMKKTKF
jgi:hypothetical protein